MLGFALARFQYLNIDGVFMKNTIPGEQYYYQSGYRRVAIIMHLAAVLPACFLVVFQFVPVIRHKAIMFHRINGYVNITLLLLGVAGALMLTRTAIGGNMATQLWLRVLATITTSALIVAYISIKTLQIDQHRAWMMRAWVWAASIISLRLIMFAVNKVLANWYTYWAAIPCHKIFFMYSYVAGIPDAHNPTHLLYPQCTPANSTTYVAVSTNPGARAGPETVAAQFYFTFGTAGWMALAIHVILLEVYFHLTPAESARLRKVSYERQLAAGYTFADRGSISASRLGDAPPGWNMPLPAEKPVLAGSPASDHTLWEGTTETQLPNKEYIPEGPNAV